MYTAITMIKTWCGYWLWLWVYAPCTNLLFWVVTGISTEVLVYGALQIWALSLMTQGLLGLELFTRLKGLTTNIIPSQNAVGLARWWPLQSDRPTRQSSVTPLLAMLLMKFALEGNRRVFTGLIGNVESMCENPTWGLLNWICYPDS